MNSNKLIKAIESNPSAPVFVGRIQPDDPERIYLSRFIVLETNLEGFGECLVFAPEHILPADIDPRLFQPDAHLLCKLLCLHPGKSVFAGVAIGDDSSSCLPFEILISPEGDLIFNSVVPAPATKGMGLKAAISSLAPTHLKAMEKIHTDVDAILAYFDKHKIMLLIDAATGQTNDERYMAYGVQAHFMGVLKD